MNLVVRKRISNSDTFYHYPFRRCRANDFISRGLKAKDALLKIYETRFCPDLSSFSDELMIENLYDDDSRVSVSVEIYRCDRSVVKDCMQEMKVNNFFEQIYFSFSNIVDRIEVDIN